MIMPFWSREDEEGYEGEAGSQQQIIQYWRSWVRCEGVII